MNPLERTLIEKAGYSHGWEDVRESNPERVILYSARHKDEALVTPTDSAMTWQLNFPKGPPTAELPRTRTSKSVRADIARVPARPTSKGENDNSVPVSSNSSDSCVEIVFSTARNRGGRLPDPDA